MDFDYEKIEQIQVWFGDGKTVIYKGKGVEKLRRLLSKCPPLAPKEPLIVDDDDLEDVSSKPVRGYETANLTYTTPKSNLSAIDLAREMQKQASSIRGFEF